jgi:hypothetical protein
MPFGQGLFANTFQANLVPNAFNNSAAKFAPTVKVGDIGLATDSASAQAAAIASSQAFRNGFSQGYTLTQLQATPGQLPFAAPSYYPTLQEFPDSGGNRVELRDRAACNNPECPVRFLFRESRLR